MSDALTMHRLQFAFTITYHYLFPQLTMGLALIIVIFKSLALKKNDPHYHAAARFWVKIFAINFTLGVITGIPMEFQFGTNWAQFSKKTGGVIGQTLAMEGVFAFFLESAFLGLFLYGEKRLSARAHWFSAFMVCLGSWLSGYFIVCTNAWMQNPVGYTLQPDGIIVLESYWALLLNPWAFWQYLHTMSGSVVTASFVVAGVGAFYQLLGRHKEEAQRFLKIAIITGTIACIFQVFPSGDMQGKMVAKHQPATLAAMEGLFETEQGAGLAIIGQPDVDKQRLDNPIIIPQMLSILTYQRWGAEVKGLDQFKKEDWPDNIPLLFYSYHIMVGLGTLFIALMSLASFKLYKGSLYNCRWLMWIFLFAIPFPYIANTAGWLTAELGRQPWLVYGLLRTKDGASPMVSGGNTLFTLLGFMGMYSLLTMLFLLLMNKAIMKGPVATSHSPITENAAITKSPKDPVDSTGEEE